MMMSQMYVMNPRRARHLGTLKSISSALYNMDMSMIEAANYEAIEQAQNIENMRRGFEEFRRRQTSGAEMESTIIPFPGQSRPGLESLQSLDDYFAP
jgi:hypothetical protein